MAAPRRKHMKKTLAKKTLAALAGALVALPVLAAGPQGFAAAPQA